MSDDKNPERGREQAETDESTVGQPTGEGDGRLSRAEWEELPSDPDLARDLGYELSSWEQFQTLDGSDQLMFLPEEEELLREDAFLVAEESTVLNLGSQC